MVWRVCSWQIPMPQLAARECKNIETMRIRNKAWKRSRNVRLALRDSKQKGKEVYGTLTL